MEQKELALVVDEMRPDEILFVNSLELTAAEINELKEFIKKGVLIPCVEGLDDVPIHDVIEYLKGNIIANVLFYEKAV